jgi:hypothetical protein
MIWELSYSFASVFFGLPTDILPPNLMKAPFGTAILCSVRIPTLVSFVSVSKKNRL